MRYLPVCLFLVTGLTAVNGQYFCNGGTDADPTIRCAQIQCDGIGNTASAPNRKQGFPTYRECGTTGGRCTVKNRAGNDLYGKRCDGDALYQKKESTVVASTWLG
ncbi:norsolorinic acid reductase [Colletotrichum higginsianum]|nr:norsolorinic acid reductase [Colletotrichum higginsianum]